MPLRWRRRTAKPAPADAVSKDLVAWAQVVDASGLSEKTVQDAEDYLRTYRRMTEFAREELAFRLMATVETQVNPPPPIGVVPLDVLATVLSVRRRQLKDLQ
jgi:hypothetical protein